MCIWMPQQFACLTRYPRALLHPPLLWDNRVGTHLVVVYERWVPAEAASGRSLSQAFTDWLPLVAMLMAANKQKPCMCDLVLDGWMVGGVQDSADLGPALKLWDSQGKDCQFKQKKIFQFRRSSFSIMWASIGKPFACNNEQVSMSHCQMLGKVESGLPAKI